MTKRKDWLTAAAPLLLLTLGHTLVTLTAFPSIGVSVLPAWLCLFALSAAVTVSCGTRASRFVTIVFAAASFLCAVLSWRSFSYMLYDLFDALQKATGHIFLSDEPVGRRWPLWIFLLCGGAILQGRAAAEGNPFYLVPLLLTVAEGSVVSVLPVGAGTAFLVLGVLLMLVLHGTDMCSALQRCTAVLLCTALTAGFGRLLRDAPQERVVESLRSAAHTLAYDPRTCSMPHGRLRRLGAWQPRETPALSVTAETPQKLYLRGWIGETYTGLAWKPLSSETRAEYAELFAWMHANDFYGQTAICSILTNQGEPETQTITVRNLAACRVHGYLPYGAGGVAALDDTLIGDALLPKKAQTFSCVQTDAATLYNAANRAADDASALHRMEQSLFAYAQNVDRTVPPSVAALFARQFGAPAGGSTASVLHTVRERVQRSMQYDASVVTKTKNDFLETAFSQQRGYSVHYATAAVLLLRWSGIPARYVEGYCLSTQKALEAQAGEEIVLTEADAHAWAEYYLDGVGFVPFEVTPGYDDEDDVQGESQSDTAVVRPPRKPVGAPQIVPEPTPSDPPPPESRFSGWWLLISLPIALAALWIVWRRQRLRRILRDACSGSERDAVLGLYGYAHALRRYGGVSIAEDDEAKALYERARFSDQPIAASDRGRMADYVAAVQSACLRSWSLPKCLYYRFLHVILL